MQEDWKEFVGEWLGQEGGSGGFDRVPLAGDASNRQYFRIHFSDPNRKSAILMEKNVAEGFKKSEEAVSKAASGPPGDPFILIGRFLNSKGIAVPALYHVRDSGAMILQEDLGDHTFYSAMKEHNEEESLTEKALSLLVHLQSIRWNDEIPWLSERRFGVDLIRWEFEHFVEYGLASVPPAALLSIREAFDRESRFLAADGPAVLVHRDYHSRNLMVKEGQLRLIDFQDLLQGSPFYDLASLLFDAYRILPMDRIIYWLSRYRTLSIASGILPPDLTLEQSEERLFRHAFQRNLKACGRFYYINDVKGNPSFLASVPGTHQNIRRLADRLPNLRSIVDLIEPYLRTPSSEREK